jgi:hypothetical protein
MEALKNLPIGVQNFKSLREDGFLYVDKTALVHKLVSSGYSMEILIQQN